MAEDERDSCAGGDADSGNDGRVCSGDSDGGVGEEVAAMEAEAAGVRGGRGGGELRRLRRQRGSGSSSSGGVDGSGEAMMGEDTVEVDERDSGASSGGDDREDGGLGEGGWR